MSKPKNKPIKPILPNNSYPDGKSIYLETIDCWNQNKSNIKSFFSSLKKFIVTQTGAFVFGLILGLPTAFMVLAYILSILASKNFNEIISTISYFFIGIITLAIGTFMYAQLTNDHLRESLIETGRKLLASSFFYLFAAILFNMFILLANINTSINWLPSDKLELINSNLFNIFTVDPLSAITFCFLLAIVTISFGFFYASAILFMNGFISAMGKIRINPTQRRR